MENLSSTLPVADKSTADLAGHPAWLRLKAAVEALRPLQSKDGSIDLNSRGASTKDEADAQLSVITETIGELAPLFPHDKAYLDAVVLDLMRWAASGYATPDF